MSPWPATAPPSITVNSPGRDQADEGARLEERERPDEQVGPGAEPLREVLDRVLAGRSGAVLVAEDEEGGDRRREQARGGPTSS